MNNVLNCFKLLLKHIVLNVSNYALLIGIGCILYFIHYKYGTPTTILSVGVLLVATSIVIEVNKKNVKKTKKLY